MSPSRAATRAALEQLIGDKYEVLGWIGGGGMAEVYLARHRVHGGRFAVKVLAEQLSHDPRIVARFLEEARTAATLSGHPNIAAVFDVGGAGAVHYLVMPYVEGEDVSRYLARNGRLTERETILIACQVTDALVWASERGIIHRDLKPSNIRIDRTGRVIVLDFGIAKAADSPSGLTTAGETPGTPYYMSPEQIRGEPCDVRSDLYSLGIVLFELLTGTRPFDGDTVRAIETAHLTRQPPPVGAACTVSPELEQIVNRLLEKDPGQRFQTAAEVHELFRTMDSALPNVKLKPEVDAEMVPTGPGRLETVATGPEPPMPPEPRPATGMNWGLVAVALAVLLAGGGGFAWWKTHSGPGERAAKPSLPEKTIQDAHGAMVLVTAGKFIFGDDAAESPHKREEVDLPAFYIDSTEVSNRQYADFVQATGRKAPDSDSYRTSPSLPVAMVTYQDAADYCAWAGRRLPSEQEWEKAARGPAGNLYPWGNEPLPSPGKLVGVEEYPERQSPYGALNLSGNVFEWTATPYVPSPPEIRDMESNASGKGSSQWRSLKGGSFLVKNELFFRCYMRRGWPVDLPLQSIGFRCVKDAK